MSLVTPPPTPLLIRLVAWIGALLISGWIVYLVFNFGYYASGLALVKEEEKLRRKTPIRMEFVDPNAPDRSDPNQAPPAPGKP
jgi:hypothetical protein